MCGIPSDRMPPHLESIHMSAHKVFCEYMCGIPSDRMPPHFLKESKVCQPTRSFVSICGGFLQIECHHTLEVSICQPTMSFVRICMGFFQIECHAKGDVPEQLQMEANHIWCDWGMVCLTVLRYFDDMCRLFCFFLAAAQKVIYVNKCGIHSDRMLLTRMLEIFS